MCVCVRERERERERESRGMSVEGLVLGSPEKFREEEEVDIEEVDPESEPEPSTSRPSIDEGDGEKRGKMGVKRRNSFSHHKKLTVEVLRRLKIVSKQEDCFHPASRLRKLLLFYPFVSFVLTFFFLQRQERWTIRKTETPYSST